MKVEGAAQSSALASAKACLIRIFGRALRPALIIVLFAVPCTAQPTTGQKIADVASYGTLGAGMALEVIDAIKAPDGGHAIERVIIGHTIAYAVQGILSTVVARPRPCAPNCGIDNPYRSWPSGHAWHAGATVWGEHKVWKAILAGTTAELRVAANKHRQTDVLSGLGFGWGTTFIW